MEKIKWTHKEVTYVQKLYLNNHSIKAIARLVNRTPTSVNKALSRFGIRKKRSGSLVSQTYERKIKELVEEQLFEQDSFETKWVNLTFVKNWLQERNVKFQQHICPLTGTVHFSIGSARLTPANLMMLFNKMRLEEGLKICWVEDVSW